MPATLAVIYSLLILLAALLGGWVPMLVRLTHTRMQLALSFVAGVILGIGLLHLVPHGFEQLGNIDHAVMWTLGGFLAMFFLERFFPFHHHDAPVGDSPSDVAPLAAPSDSPNAGQSAASEPSIRVTEHSHSHAHHHHDHAGHSHDEHHHHHESPTGSWAWGGALLGLTLHALLDGLAVGAAISAESDESHGGLAGFGTFLAVLLHKPFDSLTIGTMMAAGGWSRRDRHAVNLLYAAVAPLGVLAFFLGFEHLAASHPGSLGAALCFAGGAFLCIATSDLLPEVQFHRHDRGKLSLALLLGVALAAAIVLVETSGHAGT